MAKEADLTTGQVLEDDIERLFEPTPKFEADETEREESQCSSPSCGE